MKAGAVIQLLFAPGLATLLCVGVSSATASDQMVPLLDAPIPAIAPKAVSANWKVISGDVLPVAPAGPYKLSSIEPSNSSGRFDVFRRVNGMWVWHRAMTLGAGQTSLDLPPNDLVGILLRRPRDHRYAWGQLHTLKEREVSFQLYRSVVVTVEPGDDEKDVIVYVGSSPRTLQTVARRVRFDLLPLLPAIACSVEADRPSCAYVASGSSSVTLPQEPHAFDRLISSQFAVTRVSVASPSTSIARPANYAVELVPAGEWFLLRIAQKVNTAPEFVVDIERGNCAKERVESAALAPPPLFTSISQCNTRGIAIRPAIRGVQTPLESGARLVVLTRGTGVAARVAFATATVDADGIARLPDLGPGTYFLKLSSSMASNRIAESHVPSDSVPTVTFDAGPVVTGKLVLDAGGRVVGEPRIDVVRGADVPSIAEFGKSGDDLADWIRTVKASADGRFAFAVNLGGPYELRATWGAGVAVRKFVVKTPPEDLDLGTISLVRGASVRGIVRDCASGELHLSPLPDLSQPIRPAPPGFRRVTLDVDGRFFVDGLVGGQWLVSATCQGQRATLEPRQLSLGEQEESVVDFRVFELRPVSSPSTTPR